MAGAGFVQSPPQATVASRGPYGCSSPDKIPILSASEHSLALDTPSSQTSSTTGLKVPGRLPTSGLCPEYLQLSAGNIYAELMVCGGQELQQGLQEKIATCCHPYPLSHCGGLALTEG